MDGHTTIGATAAASEPGTCLVERLRAFRAAHREHHLTINGRKWTYLTGGTGEEVVLLLHGSESDAESLFDAMSLLERGRRVIAPTYPSEVDTIDAVVDGLAGFLDTLGVSSALIVGYSLGGYIAQALAWRYPKRTRGLALCSTGGPASSAAWPVEAQNALLTAAPETALRFLFRAGVSVALQLEAPRLSVEARAFWRDYFADRLSHVGRSAMLAHGRLVIDFLRGPRGFTPGAAARTTHTLIIDAERDRTIQAAERVALAALYPTATRLSLPGAGHLSFPTEPERFVAGIERALAEWCGRS